MGDFTIWLPLNLVFVLIAFRIPVCAADHTTGGFHASGNGHAAYLLHLAVIRRRLGGNKVVRIISESNPHPLSAKRGRWRRTAA